MQTFIRIKNIENAKFDLRNPLDVENNSKKSMDNKREEPAIIDSKGVKPLLLPNSGTDCFVNSTVNILMRVDSVRHYLTGTNCELTCPLQRELRTIFLRKTENVFGLRKLLSPRLRQGQQDSHDAFAEIFQALPPTSKSSMEISLKKIRECVECEHVENNMDRVYNMIFVLKSSFTRFGSLFREAAKPSACAVCDCQRAIKMTRREVTNATSHLLVQFCKQGRDQHVLDLNFGNVDILNANWRINSFIEYIADNAYPYGQKGHYVSWINEGNSQWTRVSDSIKETHSNVNMDIFDISMILFEKSTENCNEF